MDFERIFRRNKPYTKQEIEKVFDKKTKKIYNKLTDEEIKKCVGIDKAEIKNTYKRSNFREFVDIIIKGIKDAFMFLIDKGFIVIKYITSFDKLFKTIEHIIKALCQLIKLFIELRKMNKANRIESKLVF